MRYLITGGAGYIGGRLVDHLVERDDTERVVIADIRPPEGFRPKTEFKRLDVRDRAVARELLATERPDALVHLAFVLNPVKDEAFMYDVDVNGTANVLDAASQAGIEQVLVTSSAVAYGAHADNPVPMSEDQPLRANADFSYARDKTDCDRLCQLWALAHPERVMTIVRPCMVFGPSVDNYLVRIWLKQPFHVDFGRPEPPLQFVHVDDVADALIRLLEGRHPGAYNVAGDGLITAAECAEMTGMRTRRIPFKLWERIARGTWRVGMSEAPPAALQFAIHPWVLATDKLKDDTGWQPRHTSRETFELTMRAKGKMAPAPAPLPVEIEEPLRV